jgi:16S rRNA processing protein RimM
MVFFCAELYLNIYLCFMETIQKADCEKIGFIRKTHGVHGDVVLEFELKFEESVAETEHLFVELEGLLVPFFISDDGLRFTTAKAAIVSFGWVDTEKYAKRLVGAAVYLLGNEIIDEPEISEDMLEGFLLVDEKLGEIGMINQVDDYSGNIVFTVSYRNEEILIPYNEEILVSIDDSLKMITLNLPEGLIES